jgi:membrane protein
VLGSFSQKLSGLQAAGLTLLTVLALVPMLALASALAKGLGYAEKLDETLVDWQRRFPQESQAAWEWVRTRIAEVNFGALGVVGSIVVLWSGLVLFTRVEQAMNLVWRTAHARPWYRRISDFLAIVVVVPPLAILSLAASSVLSGLQFQGFLGDEAVAWAWRQGLLLVPHVLAWLAFTLLYKIMPSAHVHWRGALVGGVIAGSALVALHGLYVRLNVGVANANAIYLTFAALPILLVYLQLLWTIVLAGAEIAYAVQNLGTLRPQTQLPPASHRVRQRLAWHLVHAASAAFRSGRKGVRTSTLCMQLDVPVEWVDDVGNQLVTGGILVAVDEDEDLLMPARPPEQIAMPDVSAIVAGATDRFLQRVELPQEGEVALAAADAAAAQRLAALGF